MRKSVIVLSLIMLIIDFNFCYADWSPTGGPASGFVNCMIKIGTNLYAGTSGGVYLSPDSGSSWTALNNGLTDTTEVLSMTMNGSNIFIGTTGINGLSIYLSTNSGGSWSPVNSGLTNTYVESLIVSGGNIFAGTDGGGIFESTNNGGSWSAVNNGLTNLYVLSLASSGSSIYAGTTGGVYISTNSGTSWAGINNGLTDTTFVSSIVISGGNIFAGSNGAGLFLSTNSGASWTQINTGLTDMWVSCLAVSGGDVFAGTDNGIYLSTNNGANWDTVSTGLGNTDVLSLLTYSTSIFAGTDGSGVWARALWELHPGINELGIRNYELGIKISPNPVVQLSVISYQLSEESNINIEIYDLTGREIAALVTNERQQAGEYSLKYNAEGLKSGIYFIKANTNIGERTLKFIKE